MSQLFFSLIFGLIISTDLTSENGGLFFAEYLRLKSDLGETVYHDDKEIFQSKMSAAKVSDGLYKRDQTRNERTVSHDEITGFIVASKILKTHHAEEIWNYLQDNFFIYDFNNRRPYPAFHPAWIYFWGELMESSWTKIFYPVAFLNVFLATKQGSEQDTSGKLLYYTLLDRKSFLWQVYVSRMRKLYGSKWIEKVFKIYFPKEPDNHPLIFLSKKLGEL